jgi:hypothetical protein
MSPYTTHFHERAKLGPFEFVNEVIDFVGATHEFGLGSVDSDLDFAVDEIVKFGVDHDVLSSLFKPVFDSDDFEFVRLFFAHFLKFLKNLDHFILLGRVLASEEI